MMSSFPPRDFYTIITSKRKVNKMNKIPAKQQSVITEQTTHGLCATECYSEVISLFYVFF